jgi:hypothetical protein
MTVRVHYRIDCNSYYLNANQERIGNGQIGVICSYKDLNTIPQQSHSLYMLTDKRDALTLVNQSNKQDCISCNLRMHHGGDLVFLPSARQRKCLQRLGKPMQTVNMQ